MALAFKKAEKKQAKLRLAMTGPSGSGKTFSALLIAKGIGKKIALIDTENHSASLYAGEKGIPGFDTLEIEPPYTVPKYIEAMKAAVENKYDVLVIDSISHAWTGDGGLLSKKEALDVRGGNSYTNWAPVTKEHEQFKAMLLNCDIHLIATMRSKQDYILEQNEKGKSTPRKVGLAPVQREGMEYEFTLVLDMAMDHHASVSKTRINSFDKRLFVPDEKTGVELITWLSSGAADPKPPVNLAVHNPEPEQAAVPQKPNWPHPAEKASAQPPVTTTSAPPKIEVEPDPTKVKEATITSADWAAVETLRKNMQMTADALSFHIKEMGFARGSDLPQSRLFELRQWIKGG